MKTWEKIGDDITKGPGGLVKWGLIAIIVVSIISFALSMLSKPAEVIGKVMDADNILYNYEWFHSQAQDIEVMSTKIMAAKGSMNGFKQDITDIGDGWGFEDKNELSRLRSIYDGLKFQGNDMIAKYNARSAMVSREIFKSGETPDSFEVIQ